MENEVDSAGKAIVPLVTGRVHIAAGIPAFAGATMHVYLEDVSYVDAEAVAVAESSVQGIRHAPSQSGETVVSFALYAALDSAVIDARHSYSIRVWVDSDSDGKPGVNDLYSDQSYRVLTQGYGNTTTITLGALPRRSIS
jgi:hypothetical protein